MIKNTKDARSILLLVDDIFLLFFLYRITHSTQPGIVFERTLL